MIPQSPGITSHNIENLAEGNQTLQNWTNIQAGTPHPHLSRAARQYLSSDNVSVVRPRSRQCASQGRDEAITGSVTKPTSLQDFKKMILNRPDPGPRQMYQTPDKRFSIIAEESDSINQSFSCPVNVVKTETLV